LREKYNLRVGGCDYAPALIDIARRLFPTGDITAAEAADLSIVPRYDIVLANGVFHYFPNFDYARRVLERMIAKADSAVAILEVPNADTRTEAERMRRDKLTQESYEEKYRGLEHLYYQPQWFGEIATKNGCDWEYFDHPVPNYAQSRFRFDVVIRRR
jgi:trans-aconitate methyltransferase